MSRSKHGDFGGAADLPPGDLGVEKMESSTIIIEDQKTVVTKPASKVITQDVYLATGSVPNLRTLLKGDFHMDEKDKDFKLTHEQLIKVARMLLNMLQVTRQRGEENYALAVGEMDRKLHHSEHVIRTVGDEMKAFIHQLHTDFESFQRRHREEHITVNKKIFNLQDGVQRTMTDVSVTNAAAGHTATMLSCLAEHGGIGQTIIHDSMVKMAQLEAQLQDIQNDGKKSPRRTRKFSARQRKDAFGRFAAESPTTSIKEKGAADRPLEVFSAVAAEMSGTEGKPTPVLSQQPPSPGAAISWRLSHR